VVIAGPDLLDEVSRLKQAEGGDLLIWGTGQLTDALAAAACSTSTGSAPPPSSRETTSPCFALSGSLCASCTYRSCDTTG
jgi:hypothetical protein